ncbi:AraC family transcriptional regulator [Paenibacillus macerans]|uniref:AraC family transcriptional regulator n=1 Tax=Paenibacillus macerans TaxID=44252 RepID=UPI003D316AB7
MMIEYFANHTPYRDLQMTQFGIQQCPPLHDHGPAVRDHYLIHFVLEGFGRFEAGGQSYPLQPGQAFLICPENVTYYQADERQPWHYCWVGFEGVHSTHYLREAGLSSEAPIHPAIHPEFVSRQIERMAETRNMAGGRDLRLHAHLYMLLSHLAENAPLPLSRQSDTSDRRDLYVRKVVRFIETNYANRINIGQIAQFVGLDRSYLTAVFKARIGSSIQEYLIRYRMEKACGLMANSLLSIGDIARSVGYEDPLLFSKMFKKEMGCSPLHYRQARSADPDGESSPRLWPIPGNEQ